MADLYTFSSSQWDGLKNKNFKKSVQQAIQSIQDERRDPDDSNLFNVEYSGTCQGVYTGGASSGGGLPGASRNAFIHIEIGELFPDNFAKEDLFQLTAKKATKKLFNGDNWIRFNYDTNNSEHSAPVVINGGKGDDILEYDGSAQDVEMKGGKGDDILSFFADDYEEDGITNPRLTGGKGNDAFVFRWGCAVITDYEPGKDVLAIDTTRSMVKVKSRAIDGDRFIFNRRSRDPMFVLEGIDSINQVTFVPADTL